MEYYEFRFTYDHPATMDTDTINDVLAAELGAIGFDSFAPDADGLNAYVPVADYRPESLAQLLADFPLSDIVIRYTHTSVPDRDWNEEWEKNYFQPLLIGSADHPRCVVSSTFHTDVPEAEYAIKINPQMSFGTGHHQTTAQMLERLLDDEVRGLEVLDMGCGTGILAILASLRGAKHCVAVDFDEWCVRNTRDNLALNAVGEIEVVHGDATVLESRPEAFDLVIANINRNILLADLPRYVAAMRSGAHIYMSGFYTADVAPLRERAEALGLTFVDERSREDWACIKFVKA